MVVSLMICMLLEGIHRAYLYYPQCIVVGVDIVSDKRLEYIFFLRLDTPCEDGFFVNLYPNAPSLSGKLGDATRALGLCL